MSRTSMICASMMLCAAGANAQSTVTIYGLIDTAVERINNVGAARASLTRMTSLTGTLPSRIGFRGSEDLGGGLKAIFTLEQGFGPDTGTFNQGGRAWGRQSFVGLSAPWGTLTLGRQYTMQFYSLLDADTLGPNVYGMSAFDPYLSNDRTDNALGYRGFFGPWTVGATYSLGRDMVNAGPSPAGTNCPGELATDKSACREYSAMVKYDQGKWGAAASFDELKGGAGAFDGLTNSSLSDRRYTANGYAVLGALKLGVIYLRRDNEGSVTPRSDLWHVSAGYPITQKLSLDGGVSYYKVKSTPNKGTLLAARASYFFSKRTIVYATAGHIRNDGSLAVAVSGGQVGGNPVAGASQTGVAVGIRHSF